MPNTLCTVDHAQRASFMRQADNFLDRVDGAKGVGDVSAGNHLDPLIQHASVGGHIDGAGSIHRDSFHRGALLGSNHLPGHDIGMVLHGGDQHPVTWLQIDPPPGSRDQVQAFSGAFGPDNLARFGSIDKGRHLATRVLEFFRRTLSQGMRTTVHIAVVVAVIIDNRLDYRFGLLRGRCVIQIHQRMAIDLLVQNREIRANTLGVKSVGCSQRLLTHRPVAPAPCPRGRTARPGVGADSAESPAPARR